MKTINIELSAESVDKAIKELEQYKSSFEQKMMTLCERIATLGGTVASLGFSRAIVDTHDVTVDVVKTDLGYIIKASGKDVAFVEFGSGAKYGGTYPKGEVHIAPDVNTNAGAWSLDPEVGKGHYADQQGWWYPNGSGGYSHSYGNPPAMAMHDASIEMQNNIKRIVKEVFAGND